MPSPKPLNPQPAVAVSALDVAPTICETAGDSRSGDDGQYGSARSAGGVFHYRDSIDIWFWGSADCCPGARPYYSIPVEVAAPLTVLLSITIASVVIVQDWRKIHIRSTAWLLAPTFLGIPLGIALLTSVDQHVVKSVLAIVLFWRSRDTLF